MRVSSHRPSKFFSSRHPVRCCRSPLSSPVRPSMGHLTITLREKPHAVSLITNFKSNREYTKPSKLRFPRRLHARCRRWPLFLITVRRLQHACFGVPMNLLPHRTWFGKANVDKGRRTPGLQVWICAAVFGLAGVHASAAVHPVPLEPNVDSKKCLECHESTAK